MRSIVLFCICLVSLTTLQAQTQPTFHVIMIGATEDKTLARACQLDLLRFHEQFSKIAESIGYAYKPDLLVKENFSNAAIRKSILGLTCGAEDIVVFYYTGHGFNLTKYAGNFPIMAIDTTGDGNFPLMLMHEELMKKKPRFCLTIGDCCNKVIDENVPQDRSMVKGTACNPAIFRQLFLQQRGGVIVASSKRGQVSGAAPGGSFYTWSLLQSIDYACHYNERVTWEQLLDDTQTRMWSIQAARQAKQESIFTVGLASDSTATGPDSQVAVAPANPTATPSSASVDSNAVAPAQPAMVATNGGPAAPQPAAPVSAQRPDFSDVNGFLNTLADESLTYAVRTSKQTQAGQYFVHNARVKVYVNATQVALIPLDQLMSRYSTLAKSIRQVNIVERLSKLDPSGRFYTEVAVQEIWNQ
ncbi:caspase family protein [Larkinella sp. C7]|uniref:caspase family protein n=1 Tax=Larkinella sp. C7 TaxID=2576607 RepID=UPI0014867F5E|nr:caspase family protein [Larkinella sp. C7]